MPQSVQLLHFEQAEKLEFDWGGLIWYANGALGNSNEITVGRCKINPGYSNPTHYHPNCTEILVVLQGTIRHTMADDTQVDLEPGDTVTVQPNIWHRATNTGDSEALLFVVFTSPDRQTIGE